MLLYLGYRRYHTTIWHFSNTYLLRGIAQLSISQSTAFINEVCYYSSNIFCCNLNRISYRISNPTYDLIRCRHHILYCFYQLQRLVGDGDHGSTSMRWCRRSNASTTNIVGSAHHTTIAMSRQLQTTQKTISKAIIINHRIPATISYRLHTSISFQMCIRSRN